jgi:hypothetical protein
MCGANVSCKGACTGTATAPKCEGELKPPACIVDANCEASCQGHAELKASCTPPVADLECDGTATPDVTKLVATVKTHLPAILEVVSTQGPLLGSAGARLAVASAGIAAETTSLTGKAIACAGVAGSAAVTASTSVNVSVSASVSGSCGGPAS